jgi:hypothetical protein
MDGKKRKSSQPKTKLTLIRTGGFTGLTMSATATVIISPEDLEKLFQAASPLRGKNKDDFYYTLVINDTKKPISPDQAPPALKPILQNLEAKLKYQKPKKNS